MFFDEVCDEFVEYLGWEVCVFVENSVCVIVIEVMVLVEVKVCYIVVEVI